MLNTMFIGDLPIFSVPIHGHFVPNSASGHRPSRPWPGTLPIRQARCRSPTWDTKTLGCVWFICCDSIYCTSYIYIYIYYSYIRSVWFLCCDAMSYTHRHSVYCTWYVCIYIYYIIVTLSYNNIHERNVGDAIHQCWGSWFSKIGGCSLDTANDWCIPFGDRDNIFAANA